MRIRILGAGWYGCHIGAAMIERGHEVAIYDIADDIFTGASGSIPARLHLGFHYPRSRLTRAACQEHVEAFMYRYGHLTAGVPFNCYAIAETHSMVDYAQYVATLRGEVDFVEIYDPREFGIMQCEGAVLCGERHILSDDAAKMFREKLAGHLRLGRHEEEDHDSDWDWTIDCTFAAQSASGVDRYEPCVVPLLEGPIDRAITIMDGPFHSLYPWDEKRKLSSLSSAHYSPLSKNLRTYSDAARLLADMSDTQLRQRADEMMAAMRAFYPEIENYRIVELRTSIRAMPASGADQRLVDVRAASDNLIRIRAGKIDAVIHAEQEVFRMMGTDK